MRGHLGYLILNLLVQSLWLAAKCFLVEDQNKIRKNIYNCKDVSKKHNNLHCELFHKPAKASELGREIKNAKNVSLRVYVQRIVTYK